MSSCSLVPQTVKLNTYLLDFQVSQPYRNRQYIFHSTSLKYVAQGQLLEGENRIFCRAVAQSDSNNKQEDLARPCISCSYFML